MLKVWTDAAEAGTLDRYRERGSTFAYRHEAAAGRAVAVLAILTCFAVGAERISAARRQ